MTTAGPLEQAYEPEAHPGLSGAAEALLLSSLVAAPWPYGSASDLARYLLTAALLLGASLWAAGLWLSRQRLPALLLPALGLPALGLAQLILRRSAAPLWTVEALLVLLAMLTTLVFWSDRARNPAAALRLAFAILGLGTAQAVFGAVQWSVSPDRIYGRATPIVTAPFGSFVNHNHFAGLVEMGAVLAAGMALGHARLRQGLSPRSLGLAGVSLALVAAHLASRSRGGLVALVGGLALLALLWPLATSRREGRGGRRLVLAVTTAFGLLGFGVMAVPSSTRDHLATVFSGSRDSSGAYRIDVAKGTLRLAASRPVLGWGLGAYADAFPEYKRGHGDVRTTHAESDALELLAEGGLAGLFLAAALVIALVRGLGDRLRHGRDPFRKGVALGAAAAAGALLIHSVLDFNLRIPSNALVFASLLGLAASPRLEASGVGSRRAAAVAASLLLAMAAVSVWRAAGAYALESRLGPPEPQLRIELLTGVLRWHPYLPEAYRERGLAWRSLADTGTAFTPLRLSRAAADLERALVFRPRWAEAWADLGWIRYSQGDLSAARLVLARAVEMDPTHVAVGIAYAEFRARAEGAAGAIAELRRLREMNPHWRLEAALVTATRWTRERSLLEGLGSGAPEDRQVVDHVLAFSARRQ